MVRKKVICLLSVLVIERLQAQGYNVIALQFPLTSLEARTSAFIRHSLA
ncbi:MAG: hypothetical protein U0670_14200 [Anaerolineae bacterium]